MNKKLAFLFFVVLASSLSLTAQIIPPEINCVRNDTIFYTPISNSCGSFISYEVFSSSSENGPFSLLTSITDPNQSFYIHPNSSSQIIFYFIMPNYNCPGEFAVNSDTISNRPPEVGLLHTVSVENNLLSLNWDPSPSPETRLYRVYLFTDSGIDFIAETADNFYIDVIRDPNISAHRFLIAALDGCGNRSIFGDPISSVFLGSSIVPCVDGITFSWNKHENAERQELWIVKGDGTEMILENLTADAEEFDLINIPNTNIESFFIRGYINGDQDKIANSNRVFVQNDIVVKMDEIHFSKINTIDDDNLEIEWCWNQNADISKYSLNFSSSTVSDQKEVGIFNSLSAEKTEFISVNNNSQEEYKINIETTDECDGIFISESISSILLNAAPISEDQIQVTWNAFEYADANLVNYQLFEVKNGVPSIIYDGTNNKQIISRSSDGSETCFYVIAKAEGALNDGSIKETEVISNTVCTKGFPIVRMPNAFAPYGVNSIFRPLVGNTDAIVSYQMKVFSRYGELLFNSNNWDQGWNGRSGLKEMPQGVYSYLVEVEVLGGENITLQGSVMLVR